MSVTRSRGTSPAEGFGSFMSNAGGDPYQDTNQFAKTLRSSRSGGFFKPEKPFVAGSQKGKGLGGEQRYTEVGPKPRPNPERMPNFVTSRQCYPFSNLNKIGYALEPFENKQDDERREIISLKSKVIDKQKPFCHQVKQRGPFIPDIATYGVDREMKPKFLMPMP
jgi:hypothetical protein